MEVIVEITMRDVINLCRQIRDILIKVQQGHSGHRDPQKYQGGVCWNLGRSLLFKHFLRDNHAFLLIFFNPNRS